MKKFLSLVIAVVALAAVPVAFGDDNPPPSTIQTTPSGQTQNQGKGQNAGARLQLFQVRVRLIEQRFAKRCGTDGSTASQQSIDFAQKAEQRLGTLHAKVQALIAKRQQAGKDVAPLAKLDTALQALVAKIHAWLGS